MVFSCLAGNREISADSGMGRGKTLGEFPGFGLEVTYLRGSSVPHFGIGPNSASTQR